MEEEHIVEVTGADLDQFFLLLDEDDILVEIVSVKPGIRRFVLNPYNGMRVLGATPVAAVTNDAAGAAPVAAVTNDAAVASTHEMDRLRLRVKESEEELSRVRRSLVNAQVKLDVQHTEMHEQIQTLERELQQVQRKFEEYRTGVVAKYSADVATDEYEEALIQSNRELMTSVELLRSENSAVKRLLDKSRAREAGLAAKVAKAAEAFTGAESEDLAAGEPPESSTSSIAITTSGVPREVVSSSENNHGNDTVQNDSVQPYEPTSIPLDAPLLSPPPPVPKKCCFQ